MQRTQLGTIWLLDSAPLGARLGCVFVQGQACAHFLQQLFYKQTPLSMR